MKTYASGDAGDVSWNVPMGTIFVSSWVKGTAPHTWQATAASGTSVGFGGAETGAKVLALTAVEIFQKPALIKEAKDELRRARGPDFHYEPLLGDRQPPIDERPGPAE
jgi:aminobenzoyl-glutamate utilization protein B